MKQLIDLQKQWNQLEWGGALRRLVSGVCYCNRFHCIDIVIISNKVELRLLCWPMTLINIYGNCHKCYSSLFKRCFLKETEEFSLGKEWRINITCLGRSLAENIIRLSTQTHQERAWPWYQKLFSIFFFWNGRWLKISRSFLVYNLTKLCGLPFPHRTFYFLTFIYGFSRKVDKANNPVQGICTLIMFYTS